MRTLGVCMCVLVKHIGCWVRVFVGVKCFGGLGCGWLAWRETLPSSAQGCAAFGLLRVRVSSHSVCVGVRALLLCCLIQSVGDRRREFLSHA